MKKIVVLFAAMFAMTTAMAQEDCCKNGEAKAKTEKKCSGDCANCEKHERAEGRIKGMRPDRSMMMVEQLGLDEAQAEKVKALNEKYADVLRDGRHGMHPRPQMKDRKVEIDGQTGATQPSEKPKMDKQKMEKRPQMGKDRPAPEEMKKMMEERHAKMAEYEAELQAILTEEQYAKYQEGKHQKHPQMMQRRPRTEEKE